MSDIRHLMVLPRLRIQNANAISSPMTWGFPAMSAFMGLMHALERKLPDHLAVEFQKVGVICHKYEVQATREGFTRAFHLTRNPVDKSGSTAAIVEEGRIHLELSIVFAVDGASCGRGDEESSAVVNEIFEILQTMRVAGGSVMPPLPDEPRRQKPFLVTLDDDSEVRTRQFKKLCYRFLPGFALVGRDDLLEGRFQEMSQHDPTATRLDAWLDLSRVNHECQRQVYTDEQGESRETVHWVVCRPPGWIVPIPVGFGALSRLYQPGEVLRARDESTSFRFVESLYSVGQWVSPHRLENPGDMLWYVDNDLEAGLYRLNNDFNPITETA